jgi:hypothetical protein
MSYINQVPIENDGSSEQNWLNYVSCVVAVCAADGFSDSEHQAISYWLKDHGLDDGLLDRALTESKKIDLQSIASNPAARFFAPYIIRDAIRMSSIDGQSKTELAHIADVEKALGLSDAQLVAVNAVVAGHNASVALWQSVLSR